jgi:hypothetical protein
MVARAMHWRYQDVADLPADVYDILIELLNEGAPDGDHREI